MNRRTRTLPKSASWPINLGACEEGRRLKQRRAEIYPLAGLLSAFIMSAPAQAACGQWDIPAKMHVSQTNTVFGADLELMSKDGGFTGQARYQWIDYAPTFHEGHYRDGVVDGTFDASNVSFTIHWFPEGLDTNGVNSTGVYTGIIGPTGRMEGTSYDAEHPESTARWFASDVLQCQATAAAPPRPPVTLGRVQLPSGPDIGRFETICERARAARKRNSPTAPALEALCVKQGPETPGQIVKIDTESKQFETILR